VENPIDIYGFDFTVPGTPANYYKNKRNYMNASFNLTTQFKRHEIRLGAEWQRWTVRNYGLVERSMFSYQITDANTYRKAIDGDPVAIGQMRSNASINNYGYDMWGNEIDDDQFGVDGPRHPTYISAFIQDKFEAKELVINAGLRFDMIDNDDFEFDDPANPAWDPTLRALVQDSLKTKDASYHLSPRIGLAFPATDRTVFHVQYGKFVQAPRLDNIYAGDQWYNRLFVGGYAFMAPTGIGLDPEITTQYEIGFNHQFAENASFDITAFYKDIQGWITGGRVMGTATSLVPFYNVLVNGDFATTKGVEFSMTLRRTNRMAAQVNYTYSSALGTGSAPLTSIAATEQTTAPPTIVNPLDFHHPHTGSVNFDYRFGKGDGGPILEQMGLNMLVTFSSGHPYTKRTGSFGQQDASDGGVITDPRNRVPLESVNASLTPWNYTMNLRLDKTFDLGPVAANLYIYIQNLTDRQNVINVYSRTGNAWNDGFLDNAELSADIVEANGGRYFELLYDAINLNGNGHNFSREWGNLLLGHPRQIRVGLRLEL